MTVTIRGLASSVQGCEISHPRRAEIINTLCTMFSNLVIRLCNVTVYTIDFPAGSSTYYVSAIACNQFGTRSDYPRPNSS